MSHLIHEVIEFIQDHGPSACEDLAPHFPGHTLEQVSNAMHNAKHTKRLIVVGTRPPQVKMQGRRNLAVYDLAPGVETPRKPVRERPVSSIWELADRMGAQA